MEKTFYCVKLNQSAGKYLSAANTSKRPATLAQSGFDYALFFETEDLAASAIDAYLSSPNCKMSKNNQKFITIDAYKFDIEFKAFPFTNKFYIKKQLEDGTWERTGQVFKIVYLNYGNFEHTVFCSTDAYIALTKKEN